MPYRDANRKREYNRRFMAAARATGRTSTVDARRAATKQRTRAAIATFVGIDGEGYTEHVCDRRTDPAATCPGDGRCVHHYMCLIAGDQVLYTGEPLTTTQCLGFLADLERVRGRYHVGFFFDYDVTMILRDFVLVEPEKARQLFAEGREFGSLVWWRGFGFDYLPRKHFTVRRAVRGAPLITIHDTRAFFQCSFVDALTKFDVGSPAEREEIAAMKAERDTFDPGRADAIIEYSKHECRLLAAMVGKLRDDFAGASLSAHPYEGPGPVAGKVLARHVTGRTRQEAIWAAVPAAVMRMAERAYYGGRFEVAAHGSVRTPVWEYDVKSAYPWAMTQLPCLLHGKWRPGRHDGLWVGELTWSMPEDRPGEGWLPGSLGPLPFRRKDDSIHFPAAGRGWYWSVEAPDYADVIRAWTYVRQCDCEPFSFVPEMYEQRITMESERKGSGIALKLTLNSLYGKLAQRIGSAPHYNPVWAGLITALTRAKVYDVYRDHPRKVVMVATDAVFLIEPAPELRLSTQLGDWELEGPFHNFAIFQPGVYFDDGNALFKTRGVPKKEFAQRAQEFRHASNDISRTVTMLNHNHLSVRAALARNTPRAYREVGNWSSTERVMSANPYMKRDVPEWGLVNREGAAWSYIKPGNPDYVTVPYKHGTSGEVWSDMQEWADGLYDGDIDNGQD